MAEDLSIDQGARLLKGLKLPPRPEVLVNFLEEANRPTPDQQKLASVIQGDAAMSAGLLKAVNSPVFGLRTRVGAVPQAIALLGLRSVRSLVMALSVRGAFKVDDPAFMETFWSDSTARAALCARVARAAAGQEPDACHMLGLLADCAVPAMIGRYPGYREFYVNPDHDQGCSITEAERDVFGADHATVGYLLAKAWRFPDELIEAIRVHHEVPVELSAMPGPVMVMKTAEHLLRAAGGVQDEFEWSLVEEEVCDLLGIADSAWQRLQRAAA